MEPYTLKPAVVSTPTRVVFLSDPLSSRFLASGFFPNRVSSFRLPGSSNLASAPAQDLTPQFSIAKTLKGHTLNLLPLELEPFGFTDLGAGLTRTNVVRIEGLPSGWGVYLNGQLTSVTDYSGVLYMPPGRALISKNGRALAFDTLVGGRVYLGGEVALGRPLEYFQGESFSNAELGLLNFVTNDASNVLKLERLKNKSWVSVNKTWYQADTEGEVSVALPVGSYQVLVTDRLGQAYAYYPSAQPGDLLRTSFRYSAGYAYYGFYSGKTAAGTITVDDKNALDSISVTDLMTVKKFKNTESLDNIILVDTPRGSKSPAKTQDNFSSIHGTHGLPIIKDEPYYAIDYGKPPVHNKLYEDFFWNLNFINLFNTRKKIEEFVTLSDSSNRPASRTELDVINESALGVWGRLRTRLSDLVYPVDNGSITLRQTRLRDVLTLVESGSYINLAKWIKEIIMVDDPRVSSFVSFLAFETFRFFDSASNTPAGFYLRDYLYHYEALTFPEQAHFKNQESFKVLDSKVGWLRSTFSEDSLLTKTSADLLSYGAPYAFPDLFKFNAHEWQPGKASREDLEVTLASAGSQSLYTVAEALLFNEADKNNTPYEAEASLSEQVYLSFAKTKKTDEVTLSERPVLTRSFTAYESFNTQDKHAFPTDIALGLQGIAMRELFPYNHAPEVVWTKNDVGKNYAAYISRAGSVFITESNADGSWTNTQGWRALEGAPNEYRQIAAAATRGNELYFAVEKQVANQPRIYVYQWDHVLKQASPVESFPGSHPVLAATHRYSPYGQVVIAFLTPNSSSTRRLIYRSVMASRHPFAQEITGQEGPFAEGFRLDQAAVGNGQLILIGDIYRENPPVRKGRTWHLKLISDRGVKDRLDLVQKFQGRYEPIVTEIKLKEPLAHNARIIAGDYDLDKSRVRDALVYSKLRLNGLYQPHTPPELELDRLTAQQKFSTGRLVPVQEKTQTADTLSTDQTFRAGRYVPVNSKKDLKDTLEQSFKINQGVYSLV